jgi:SAM-dependent methyltransferase
METPAHAATGELMDEPGRSARELRETLRDLRWINRRCGGQAAVLAHLERALPAWTARRTSDAPLRVLDVGTGGADIPAAAVEWARRRGVRIRVIAVDLHPVTARIARDATRVYPEITVVCADARALPFGDGAFDVCLCTLMLHHLAAEERGPLLRRLDRLARVGFLAVDLLSRPEAYAGVWLLTRLARSPLTRHDGPLSVRRALSWHEYRRLAAATGIPGIRTFAVPPFRVGLERIG